MSENVNWYRAYLDGQDGRRRALPAKFIKEFQPHFKTSLADVKIYDGVDTISGNVVTMGGRIYFPSSINFAQASYVERLLHEFEHVEQQDSMHNDFYVVYLRQSVSAMAGAIKSGAWSIKSVHDNAGLELEAENKAQAIMRTAGAVCKDKFCFFDR